MSKSGYEDYAKKVAEENFRIAIERQKKGAKLKTFEKQLLIMNKYGLEMGDTVLIKMLNMGHTVNWDNYNVVHRAHIERVMKEIDPDDLRVLISDAKKEEPEMDAEHRAHKLAEMIEDMKERYFCRILLDAFLKERFITEEEADLHWDKAYGGKFPGGPNLEAFEDTPLEEE